MTNDVISKQAIAMSFGRAAPHYDSVAHFQRWVGHELLAKACNLSASSVLDLGCGTGYFVPELQRLYPQATLLALDLSEPMVQFARSRHDGLSVRWLVGDAESLPLPERSIDLIFSNLSLQWCGNLSGLFKELERVLSAQGVLIFSTVLAGSLVELKSAWAQVDSAQHVNEFAALEEYRVAIRAAGLDFQGFETATKALRYRTVKELTRELKMLGAHNMTPQRCTHVTSPKRVRQFIAAYNGFELPDASLPATYEILWGMVSKAR